MSLFKVSKVLNQNYVYDNIINHNKEDFNSNSLYLQINGIVYQSASVPNILKGYIGLSITLRNKLGIDINDSINVEQYEIKNHILDKISFNVRLYQNNDKKNSINIFIEHEDELIEKTREIFKDFYFSSGQVLIMKHKGRDILLDVKSDCNGYIKKNGKIDFISNDVNVTIINGKIIKRELFKENYDFSEIGIGGLDSELLVTFRRALSTRAYKQSVINNLGIKHVKGILLYGPPGTGKTLIARKIGGLISNIPPKIVNGPEIMNKWVGGSEENIRKLFEDAISDKNGSDLHVIIFDEIDAICRKRGSSNSTHTDTVVNQLLSMIDGVNQLNNIFIIAMTNRKELLDEALLRAGRLEVHIQIGLPDKAGREQIFKIHTSKMASNNCLAKNIDISRLASLSENYSGAEIESVVNNATSTALYEKIQLDQDDDDNIIVTMDHFIKACNEIVPNFGNNSKILLNLLPAKYVNLSSGHLDCYTNINKFIKEPKKLKTILINGSNGTGKTTLVSKILLDNDITHKKIITSYDMISFDDFSKAQYLIEIFNKAYLVDNSIIVIDDIEIFINYTTLGESIIFTNKLYQTLITLLKTAPLKNHELTIIITCSDNYLNNKLISYFDLTFDIKNLTQFDISNVVTQLGNENITVGNDMSVKELLLQLHCQ